MAKFAIGEKVDNVTDDHEGGTVIAVFPTVDQQISICCRLGRVRFTASSSTSSNSSFILARLNGA